MQQGYKPPQEERLRRTDHRYPQHQPKKNRKLLIIIIASVIVIAIIGTILIVNMNRHNQPGTSNYVTSIDAAGFAQVFIARGLPVFNIIAYNEETDINGLLGRPNSYTSKVNFADSRIEQYDEANPHGGTVEVFANIDDAKARYDYTMTFSGSILGSYCFLNGNVLLRIDYQLTPEQASEYEAAMMLAMGVIPSGTASSPQTTVNVERLDEIEAL